MGAVELFIFFSLFNGHKACELGHNGVVLADVDDVRLSVPLEYLYK